MTYSKLFAKQIPSEQIVDDIKTAITTIYSLPVGEYNSDVFHDIAVGFKSIVYNMEIGTSSSFPLFLKWLKLYVRLQHQIDPKNNNILSKFEKRIPVCTSFIIASLQYQTKISNYHLQTMEMCLSLFNSASPEIMKIVANLEIEIIALFWMPIEFVGDYNTQKLSLKLIAKVLECLNESDRRKRVAEIERNQNVRNLLLRLTMDDTNFEKISRELLNTFNMRTTKSCAVFSVNCTTALFGSFELFKPESVDKFWIDFNYTSKSVSFLCQLNQSYKKRQELSIQIKIDNLQIDNQFDCIVLSIEPAIFSIEVSTELKNARIAVFTLPQSEIERLKANRDLLDFYNKSYNNFYSESDVPPTPNTIENYLAETDYPETPRSLDTHVPSPAVILPEVSLNNVSKKSRTKPTQKSNEITAKSSLNSTIAPKKQVAKNTTSSITVRELPNSGVSIRESGYNTSVSTVRQDSTVFKKPTRPVRRKTAEKPPTKAPTTVLNRKSVPKQPDQPNGQPKLEEKSALASQSLPLSGSSSRRFFKPKATKQTNGTKQTDMPSTKPKRASRKRPSNTTDTGISPKRKQVNTVKPLNHLTKPDCDPEEAALEYVENGGYDNIITFLRSNLGATCFNEEQRQQIIENVEKINEDIERSTRRFFQKDANSDTESASIWRPNARRRKAKAVPRVAHVANFVPYSMWKIKQKKKTSAQSTMVQMQPQQQKQQPVTRPSLNMFDQLKLSSPEITGASCNKPSTSQKAYGKTTAVADNRSCSSSASSCSNHNFHIAESDTEMVEGSSDEEILPADMVCRQMPEERELSPVPVPIEVSQMRAERRSRQSSLPSSQVSLPSDDLDIVKPSQYQVEAVPLNSCHMSEIYEDLDEIPPGEFSQDTAHPPSLTDTASEKSQAQSVYSSITTILHDVHTESDQHQNSVNTWYIDKYLKDQQLFVRPPHVSPTCFDSTPDNEQSSVSRPQNVTTNQVIIQNQIVLSTVRKRMITDDHEESSLAKIPSDGDRLPLRGYAQLLPSYMEKLTKEKDRLLKELEGKLQQDFFENFNEIADEVMKSIAENETAINEAQEQLSFIFGKLEWLIENQQKNKSQLESIYCQLIGRIKASMPIKQEIDKAYEEVAERLDNYATTMRGELWQSFANGVVSSIEDRLKGLVRL